jgi:uncharacterized LabA/DUF88 family protein
MRLGFGAGDSAGVGVAGDVTAECDTAAARGGGGVDVSPPQEVRRVSRTTAAQRIERYRAGGVPLTGSRAQSLLLRATELTSRRMWLSIRAGPSLRDWSVNPPGVWRCHTPGFFYRQIVTDRAVVFVDGNNWFHALCNAGVADRGRLDYRKISEKLLGPREWIGTRYYIGQVNQKHSASLYAQQRSFLAGLTSTDPRIAVHFGRIEPRVASNEAAKELREYLVTRKAQIDAAVFADLDGIATRHAAATVFVEKAVDVFLAIDLVTLAISDTYDAAYLLTADGDYTPAVEAVRKLNKKVYAASCLSGAQLARAVNTFIHLQPSWFTDCYRDGSR